MNDPATQRRLTSAKRLLESDNAGERGAALNAVQRLPAKQGKSIVEVLAKGLQPAFCPQSTPPPRIKLLKPWQRKAWLLLVSKERWDKRSRDFLESMRVRNAALTDKQAAYLSDLGAKAERNRSHV